MMDLTILERAVLTKILQGEYPLLRQLRCQLDNCHVIRRELTGVGFFTYLEVKDGSRVDELNVRFGDVLAEIEGMVHGAGFLLYVEQGWLSMLEGYSYDEPWPSAITTFNLRYIAGEERDWATLRNALG